MPLSLQRTDIIGALCTFLFWDFYITIATAFSFVHWMNIPRSLLTPGDDPVTPCITLLYPIFHGWLSTSERSHVNHNASHQRRNALTRFECAAWQKRCFLVNRRRKKIYSKMLHYFFKTCVLHIQKKENSNAKQENVELRAFLRRRDLYANLRSFNKVVYCLSMER